MPELPEVEAARRAIQEHCVGKRIKNSTVADDTKVIDAVSPADFQAAIAGKTIVAAHRKGKNMWIELDSPPFPSFQFGMAGAIYIKGVAVTKYKRSAVKDTDEWPSKYSKLFVELDDGLEFSFTDKRRFAKVRLLDDPASKPPISELGPDALFEPMTEDGFFTSLSKKKIGIKALLLDQSFMSGIGNWMADEVLYQARIHPLQTASSIPKENCTTLLKCINEVTNLSVEVGADDLRFPVNWLFHFRWGKKPGKVIEKAMEVGADSSQFPSDWIFHSREKKPGKAFVNGKKIEFINAGGRTSAYVPELQKLPSDQAAKEAAKPSKGTKKSNIKNDEFESEEESKKPKATKGRTTSKTKKPSSRKKASASVEDSDSDDNEDENDSDNAPSKIKQGAKKRSVNEGAQTRPTRGRRAPPKRKYEESDDEGDDSSEGDIDNEDDEAQEASNGKQAKAGAVSKKKVGSSQTGNAKKTK